jgi:predicted ATP-grasp superfamily ATP-dependent carboligase
MPNGYAVKVIVFAKEKSIYPELSGIKNIFDISRVGVNVDKGNPICTVQVTAKERDKAIRKALGKVSEIYGRM